MEEHLQDVVEQVSSLIGDGRFKQARRVIRRFMRLKVAPSLRTQLKLLLGSSYLKEGRWKQALESFDAVVKDAGSDASLVASALNYIGDCYLQRGQSEAARRYYIRSLELCEKGGVGGDVLSRNLADLAHIATISGRYGEAVENWRRAAELCESTGNTAGFVAALLNLAVYLRLSGEVEQAEEALQRCLNLTRTSDKVPYLHDVLRIRSYFLEESGDYGAALSVAEEALRHAAAVGRFKALGARWGYANTLMKVGMLDEARKMFEELALDAARFADKNLQASCRYSLGRIRELEGDINAAVHFVHDARNMLRNLPPSVTQALMAVREARLLLKLSSPAKAAQTLKQAKRFAHTDNIILKTAITLAEAETAAAVNRPPDEKILSHLLVLLQTLRRTFVSRYLNIGCCTLELLHKHKMWDDAVRLAADLLTTVKKVAASLPNEPRMRFLSHPVTRRIAEGATKALFLKGDAQRVENVLTILEEALRSKEAIQKAIVPRAGDVVWGSREMEEVVRLAKDVARSGLPVLIVGETGVGKEVVANLIHRESGLRGKFVALNCAAIPSALLEAELFGHTRGAFTGADADREGLFQAANGGTLFLDEIGEMAPEMQAKLLRALEEGRVRRLGATTWEPVNVRLVCATSVDPEEALKKGRLRRDLFFRINAVTIKIPPLRQRKDDIPLLIAHFIRLSGRDVKIAPDALEALLAYHWPGNVRELKNEIQRLIAFGEPVITKRMLKEEIRLPRARGAITTLQEMEKRLIEDALAQANYNKKEAARILGISRTTLYEKIKRYGIVCPDS